MLLAVDVGNTNVTVGAFKGDRLVARWSYATDSKRTEDEHALLLTGLLGSRGISGEEMDAAVMCSVVPPVTRVVKMALSHMLSKDPLVIGPGVRTGIRINYDRTQDVGADRVVDAVAAHRLYGGPDIIVDFGTATVFDAVTADGEYVGGAIAPGVNIAAEALYQATAQLRRVEIEAPPKAIGRTTVTSLQSGLLYGYVGLVEGMVKRFKDELSPEDPARCTVIATGGLATLIRNYTDVFTQVNLDLTLIGLRLVHEMYR
jgi:type III pantothenate kinase